MDEEVIRVSKILANSTRRKILEFIKLRESVSYVEIRKILGNMNTGQLNYHLKVIDNLLSKDVATGKYSITEAGIIALNFNLNSAMSINNDASSISAVGRAKVLVPSELIGVIAPVFVLSSMTYYLLFYLKIGRFPVVFSILALWMVVVLFILRGTFYQANREESLVDLDG